MKSLKCPGGLDLFEILRRLHFVVYEIDCDAFGGHSSKHDNNEDNEDESDNEEDVTIVKQSTIPLMGRHRVTEVGCFYFEDLKCLPSANFNVICHKCN